MNDDVGNKAVPIARVQLAADDHAAVQDVLASGWLVQGHECERFEDAACALGS